MKKSSILFIWGVLLCIGVLSSAPAIAQNSTARYGFKGGLNVSNLYNNDLNDKNARFGFNAGVYGQLFSSETFAIQPELLYSTKGNQAQFDGTVNEKVRFNLNYLELPVLAVFKLGKAAEVHVGGYASYLLNVNVNYTGNVGNGAEDLNRDKFKTYDLGLSAGFGLNFGAAQVGARYNYGMVQIANSSEARNFLGNSKNSCAQLYVAFNLNNR
jgi:Outer membrane protein beta-barrel domain